MEAELTVFPAWVEVHLVPVIENVRLLTRHNPKGLANPILNFAVPRAMHYVVERNSLEVFEAWDLTSNLLRQESMRGLSTKHEAYRHLAKIRDKLVAHRIENVTAKRAGHQTWYKKRYGSHLATLELILSAADLVTAAIRRIEKRGILVHKPRWVGSVPEIEESDIDQLFMALRSHGIY